MTLVEWKDKFNELWLLGEKREHAADVAAISLVREWRDALESGVTRHSKRFRLLLKSVQRRIIAEARWLPKKRCHPKKPRSLMKSKSEAASSGTC